MSGPTPVLRSFLGVAALALASTLLAAVQQTPAAPPGPPPVRTGLIIGRVVDQEGAPVPEALIRLAPWGGAQVTSPAGGNVVADSQGRFFFTNLAAGNYGLNATSDGYSGGVFDQRRPGGSSGYLTLGANEQRTDVTLTLWKFAVIAGTVVDEAGEPVIGVGVRAVPRTVVGGRPAFGNTDTPYDGPMAVTDDRGQFRLPRLLPGAYAVFVPSTLTTLPTALLDGATTNAYWSNGIAELAPRGQARTLQFGDTALSHMTRVMPPRPMPDGRLLVYPPTYFPSAPSPADATPVVVASGDERAGIAIAMKAVPGFRVSGRLVTPDGTPPPPMGIKLSGSASVGVTDSDLSSGVGLPLALYDTAVTMSDGAGRFTLLGVPPGDYTVRHGRRILYPAVAEGTGYWVAQPLTVGNGNLADVVVNLRPVVRVEGRIEVARGLDPAALPPGLARGAVSFLPVHGGPGSFAAEMFNANGPRTFGSAGGSGGSIVVVPSEIRGWVVESVTIDGKDLTDRAYDLQADVTSLVVTYTNRVSRVSGTATDARGTAVPSVMVVAFPVDETRWRDYGPEPRRVRSAYGNDRGAWAFDHLPPAEYFVVALDGEDPHLWRDPERLKTLSGQATRVTVSPATPSTVTLRVVRRGR